MPNQRLTMREYHLGRVQRGRGREQQLPGARNRSHVVKFLEKVEITPGGCWAWQAHIRENGYGYYRHPQSSWAHRVSYLLFKGPIPEGLTIDHLCRNRACVNPDHLEAVTNQENVQRGKPWLACDRIHPDAATRLGKRKDGRDFCLECGRVRERERRAMFAEEQARKSIKRSARNAESRPT